MIKLHVWGAGALFTRPEIKTNPVSYDVLTPSAARGILDAIHRKPAMLWEIKRITVLNPIRTATYRWNGVADGISTQSVTAAMRTGSTQGLCLMADDDNVRVQRTSLYLKDVAYIIEASVRLTREGRECPGESVKKHLEIFKRRASRGQCFHRPYLGCREFACDFALIDGDEPLPHPSLAGTFDLGYMLHDTDYRTLERHFFRAKMVNGVINVPPLPHGDTL